MPQAERGPWEDYKPKVERGPWEDFAPTPAAAPQPTPSPTGPLPGSTARLRRDTRAPEERGEFSKFLERINPLPLLQPPQDATESVLEGVGGAVGAGRAALIAKRMFLDPSVHEYKEGATPLGAIPILGPLVAQTARDVMEENYGGLVGTAAMLFGPKLASVVRKPIVTGLGVRRTIKRAVTRAEGEAELTSLTRRDANDPNFREAARIGMPRMLDEIGGGNGVKAGLAKLEKIPENQVFEVVADGAKHAARRAFIPVENAFNSTTQQPIRGIGRAVQAEIEGQISDGFRQRYPSTATRLEEIGNSYSSARTPTRGEVFKDFVDVSQEIKSLESKTAFERASIVRADPEWGYMVGIKKILRKRAFEGLPDNIYKQYKEYGKIADIRDELMGVSTVMQGHVQPGRLAAAAGGLETSALGAMMGRGGTIVYGASKAGRGFWGTKNPAKQFIRALKKIDYDDPSPHPTIPQVRGLLSPAPETIGQEFRPGPPKLLGPGERQPNYPPPVGDIPLGHRKPGGDVPTEGRFPAISTRYRAGERLADQVREARIGRTAQKELSIKERRVLSKADRIAERLALRDELLKQLGARKMSVLPWAK